MNEWFANPLFWIAFVSLLSVAAGAIFASGQWKGKVDSDRASFKEFMTEVRNDIKELLRRSSHTLAGSSPLRLTNLGKSISERLDAPALAQCLAPLLQERVEGKTPYEIQEMCFDYIRHQYNPPDEIDTLIKTCAYDNGIDRGQVVDVLAIELRDRLLGMVPRPSSSGE